MSSAGKNLISLRNVILVVLLLGIAYFGFFFFGSFLSHQNASTVDYVFPDGFSGIAKIRSVKSEGVTLVENNGVVTLDFPPSGVLEIKGKLPIFDWHKPVAHYQSGKTIPVATPPNEVSDNEIALRDVSGTKQNTEEWYVVGKFSEIHAAQTQMNGFEFPPNTNSP
jgi:hypothetical protein